MKGKQSPPWARTWPATLASHLVSTGVGLAILAGWAEYNFACAWTELKALPDWRLTDAFLADPLRFYFGGRMHELRLEHYR